jgi:hypothetical protein
VHSIRQLLNVPEPYILIALIAAGYSDERPSPAKKQLNEVIFLNRLG